MELIMQQRMIALYKVPVFRVEAYTKGRVLELESERLLRVSREEGMVETAKRMLRCGRYTMEEIISISGLSENEIKALRK